MANNDKWQKTLIYNISDKHIYFKNSLHPAQNTNQNKTFLPFQKNCHFSKIFKFYMSFCPENYKKIIFFKFFLIFLRFLTCFIQSLGYNVISR